MQLLKILTKSEAPIPDFQYRFCNTLFFNFLGRIYLACVEKRGDMALRIFEYFPRRECDVFKLKTFEKINFQTEVSDMKFHEDRIVVIDESSDIFIVKLGKYFHMH